MIIRPTRNIGDNPTKRYLTIGIAYEDGYDPITYFRSQDVGLIGMSRRASQRELRLRDREQIASMQQFHPNGKVFVQRTRHA